MTHPPIKIWGQFRNHSWVELERVYSWKGMDHLIQSLQTELGPEWRVWPDGSSSRKLVNSEG